MFNIVQAEQGVALSRLCGCNTLSEKDLLYNILLNAGGSGGGLPSMTGHSGEFLTNDGTDAFWAAIPGGGDVLASGTLTNNAFIVGGGGTTVKAITTQRLAFANLAQGAALSVLGVTGNATANVASIAAAADHQVLRRSGTALSFGALNLAQAAAITGTLPVGNGGTGQTSFTDGQLLIGNTAGNTLAKATLTAGTNITITNGNGTITIAASGGGGGIGGSTGATDNAILRADGAGGATLQSSSIVINDVGSSNVTLTTITGTSLTLATLDSNKNIILAPHGTGVVATPVIDFVPSGTGVLFIKDVGGGFMVIDSQTATVSRVSGVDIFAVAANEIFSSKRLTITQSAANTSILASTGYSLTGSNATSMIDLAGTWNTTGAPTAFKLNITNTASDAASLMMDLQASSSSVFKVAKTGDVTSPGWGVFGFGSAGGTYPYLKLLSGTGGLEITADNSSAYISTVSNATPIELRGSLVKIQSGIGFQLGNAATTGLTPGVFAATTDATIVLTDGTGQAYRVAAKI